MGDSESFFDLGGDSLKALHLLEAVERMVGREVSLQTLVEAPTVQQFVRQLRKASIWAPARSMVSVKTTGSRPPFFCIPPGAMVFDGFLELSRLLHGDQPFYLLQYPGMRPGEEPYACIEDLAGHFVNEVRRIQPEGPCKNSC